MKTALSNSVSAYTTRSTLVAYSFRFPLWLWLGVCCCRARRFPPRDKNVLLMILMCTLLNDNGNKVLALEALFDSIAPANFYYRYASTWKWRKSIASLSVLLSCSQFSSKTVHTAQVSEGSRRCRAKSKGHLQYYVNVLSCHVNNQLKSWLKFT